MKVGDLVYAHNLPACFGIKRGFVGIVYDAYTENDNYVYVFVLKESIPRVWKFGNMRLCPMDELMVLGGSQ